MKTSPSGDIAAARSSPLTGRAPLGLHLTITSIHDIDTTKGVATICFDADIFIKIQKGSAIKMDCGKIPETREQAVEELKAIFAESFALSQITTERQDMTSDDWGEGILPDVIGGEVKFTVTQKVKLDLEDFPFDVQDIPLRFYQQYDRAYEFVSPSLFWESTATSLYALPMTTTPSVLISEEWDLHAPLLTFEQTNPLETISAYTQVTVNLKLSRKGTGYAIRFMSVMAMMSLCAILPLLVKPVMDAGSMLGYEIGLLFAVVAFQLLVSSFLPITSTATILDKYAFFLFGFVFACMSVITVGSFLSEQSDGHNFKNSEVHAGWLFGIWCIFHVYFLFMVRSRLRQRATKLVSRSSPLTKSYRVRDGQTIAQTIGNDGLRQRPSGRRFTRLQETE